MELCIRCDGVDLFKAIKKRHSYDVCKLYDDNRLEEHLTSSKFEELLDDYNNCVN